MGAYTALLRPLEGHGYAETEECFGRVNLSALCNLINRTEFVSKHLELAGPKI